jgi:transposase
VVSERGRLLRYVLTGGQTHDVTQATSLVDGDVAAHAVVGDRAYDSDAFIAHVEALGMKAVVPSRARRKVRRSLDVDAYRGRNVIERFFGRLKQYRRVATRYDKTVCSYASFVATASAMIVLSGWNA